MRKMGRGKSLLTLAVLTGFLVLSGCTAFRSSETGLVEGSSIVGMNQQVQEVPVTVRVIASDGETGVSGVRVRYGTANTYTTWWFGTTGDDGTVTKNLAPGTYSFQALYNNGHAEKIGVVIGDEQTEEIVFCTVKLTLRLETCGGVPLDGGKARFGAGSTYTTSWFPGGATGSSAPGETEAEFFPGTYSFEMQYKATAEQKLNVTIPNANTKLTWRTTKVTLYYSGQISYGGPTGDSTWFEKPSMELLPGTYWFHFRGGGRTTLTINGCCVTKAVNVLVLKGHDGAPLRGGTARGGFGDSYWTWHVEGSTDNNGVLLDIREVTNQPKIMSYEMKYNNTTQVKIQDVSVNSIFHFQTILLTLRLETCAGVPLDGGKARFGAGSTYTTSWFPGGTTGSSAPGETEAEFFPGTYSFEMQYKATAEQKLNVTIPNANTKLTWRTTKVTLYYSGQISYGGPTGDSTWFEKPSMELLPGTYWFHFRGAERRQLTFSGCEFTYTYSE